jgi:PiT family inorganic phosphate transporter
MDFNKFDIEKTREALAEVREILKKNEPGMNKIPSQENIESEVKEMLRDRDIEGLRNSLAPLIYMDLTPLYIQMDVLSGMLKGKESFEGMGRARLWDLRNNILMLDESVRDVLATERMRFSREDRRLLGKDLKFIRSSVEYVPSWVIIGVALSLGVGTMIGWKRVVVTIGEKIGKTHMTYGQGFAAQLVAALTIFMGNALGMPVSTTHVLSSGVAGGMVATKSGLHAKMLMNILVAWLLTLPMSMLIAGTLYALFRIAL